MSDRSNRVLVAVDCSNFEYVCIWAAFSKWQSNNSEESSTLVKAEEADQENLPNLLNFQSFRKELKTIVQNRLESIKWIARKHHQAEIDLADDIDIIMSQDDRISNSFRKKLYPEYKAQRHRIKKNYDVFAIKDYIENVLLKELDIENTLGIKTIKIEGCESDDITAIMMKRFPDYSCRIIISSDKDFLQLENVYQYDFGGYPVERKIYRTRHEDNISLQGTEIEMTPKEYLIWKIINGDISDNIKHVFDKCGEKKSYKLMKDIPTLKKMLLENQEAAQRYKLNRTLIDFSQIPKEMEDRIFSVLEDTLKIERKEKLEINNFIEL